MKQFVVLQGIENGNVFYSERGDKDPRYSAEGELWYNILLETDDAKEAEAECVKHWPEMFKRTTDPLEKLNLAYAMRFKMDEGK